MRAKSLGSVPFYTLLITSWTVLLLAGCGGKSEKALGKPNENPEFSSLSEKDAACETKLRARMLDKSLVLLDVAKYRILIQQANGLLRALPDHETSLVKSADQTVEVSVTHGDHSKKIRSTLEYTLGLNDRKDGSPLRMEVTATFRSAHEVTALEQDLEFTAACEPLLQTTSLKIIRKNTADYSHLTSSAFANGEETKDEANFTIPKNGSVGEFSNVEDNHDINQLSGLGDLYTYVPRLGLAQIRLTPTGAERISVFGQDLLFNQVNMELSANGTVLINGKLGSNVQAGIAFSQFGEQTTWTVPQQIWEAASLGSLAQTRQRISSKLSKEYLESHRSMILQTEHLPEYDHFSAYWSVQKIAPAPDGATSYLLTENQTGLIVAAPEPADLISNDTIQTKLPEIQSIANKIKTDAGSDRKKQISLILKYLSSSYEYDEEMVAINSVRPLTTREALDRKKGVCQHYAVIFVAVARALNIPSRIVAGYNLWSGSPVSHAWVEAEVAPHLWQVIEPQYKNGLTTTEPRYYLPTSRGKVYEDSKTDLTENFRALLNQDFVILPVK